MQVIDNYSWSIYRASDKNLPLLSGKRGLYTIHPIKNPEMIELDSRVTPTDQPQPQSEHVYNVLSVEGKSVYSVELS